MVRLQALAVLTSSLKLCKEASSSYYIEGISKEKVRIVRGLLSRQLDYAILPIAWDDKNPAHSALIAFQSATEMPQVSPDPSSSSEGVGHETSLGIKTESHYFTMNKFGIHPQH